MANEPKRCPWCPQSYVTAHKQGHRWYYKCSLCLARGPSAYSEVDALRAWNHRTTPATNTEKEQSMKVTASHDNEGTTIHLKEIFCNTVLETAEGNRVAICMRDDTIEFNVIRHDPCWWRIDMATGMVHPMGTTPTAHKLTEHWLETALSRIRAGEPEREVMRDYGYDKGDTNG